MTSMQQQKQQSSMSRHECDTNCRSNLNLIEVLKHDHSTVKCLFDEYKTLIDPQQKKDLVNIIIRELCMHANTEEMVVYPALRDKVSEEVAKKCLNDHLEVEKMLEELDSMNINDAKMDTLMQMVEKDTLEHVQDEETHILPKMQEVLGEEEMQRLAKSFHSHKTMAPSRPHPSAPKEGFMGMAAKVSAKPLDALKDTARFAGSAS